MSSLTLAYGLLLTAGGIAGYAKTKSRPSLIAGVSTGAVLVYASQLMSTSPSTAHMIVQVTCLLLTVTMGRRFLTTRKVMPAGLITILSLLMVVKSYYRL